MSKYKNLRCLTCLFIAVVGACFADKTAHAYYGSSSYYYTDNPGIQYAVADLDLDATKPATRETQYIRRGATQINKAASRQGAIVKANTSSSYDGECYEGEECCEGEDKVVKNTIIVRMKKKPKAQPVQQVVVPQKKVVKEEETFKFNSSRNRVKEVKGLNVPYVFGGYSALLHPNLSLSNPTSAAFCKNCVYKAATKSKGKMGHGFNIGAGFKHYFKDKPEGFFIAPEIFYHWLGGKAITYNGQAGVAAVYEDMANSMTSGSTPTTSGGTPSGGTTGNTSGGTTGTPSTGTPSSGTTSGGTTGTPSSGTTSGGTTSGNKSNGLTTDNQLIGMTYKAKLKHLVGVSLRLGGTKYGFSAYGKVNLGIVSVGHSFSASQFGRNAIMTNLNNASKIYEYKNNTKGLLSGQSKTTFNLVGGIGAGIEYAFASDFFVRLQYDHYWTLMPLTKLKSNAFLNASGGNTWKPKMSFGILTLNVGIMW